MNKSGCVGPMKQFLDLDYGQLEFLDKNKVKNVIEQYKKGDNKNSKLVWRIAMLNYWVCNFR